MKDPYYKYYRVLIFRKKFYVQKRVKKNVQFLFWEKRTENWFVIDEKGQICLPRKFFGRVFSYPGAMKFDSSEPAYTYIDNKIKKSGTRQYYKKLKR